MDIIRILKHNNIFKGKRFIGEQIKVIFWLLVELFDGVVTVHIARRLDGHDFGMLSEYLKTDRVVVFLYMK